MRALVLYLLVLSAVAACSGPRQEPASLCVTADQPDARLAVTVEGGQAVVDVFSESGIGSAGLEVTSQKLPEKLLLRFHLAGLEGLELAYGDVVISASLLSHSGNPVLESVRTGAGDAQEVTPGSPYWLRVDIVPEDGAARAIPLAKGYIQVELPEDLIRGEHRRFTVRWIDFYR